ncbi:MAG: ADP-ribose pyrophosphatase [Candidatus Thermofonsia Clade 1 bacterium]|jgi:ADP-ribose pyrophosphatase YjhB (NUDIX family)|uniref:ADP-ribose pyrophosphatase n=1 Tax=Candidatus Thermofonsia Clade 1 bacterium TaxID=2364210 RepID=A0A2M8PXU7_9CHLR|nr:MAG: ADP-ribose pyrophosphatase [Candidatus Thermofonsia Clade 1 bacterium]PJF42367.1 MAG: ADP-ribose pyrophosphatase [Candidatus Thermofonsia Clade 1 bacterium]RMF51000.1 MAG: NUDIX hydrolase [Chloroflexota bacterium]
MTAQRLANLLRRAPWLIHIPLRLARPFHAHVTVGAVGAVFNAAGQLLLVEHLFHPLTPWGLPGGGMNRGETPDQTVRRELLEETALQIEIVRPLIITKSHLLPHHLDIGYLCRLSAPDQPIRLSRELLAYRWFSPEEPLPPLSPFHAEVVRLARQAMAASPIFD